MASLFSWDRQTQRNRHFRSIFQARNFLPFCRLLCIVILREEGCTQCISGSYRRQVIVFKYYSNPYPTKNRCQKVQKLVI